MGIGDLKKSTLLKKLNTNDRQDACDEMKWWVYDEGIKQKGLMTCRELRA
ncbi:MAG TPA: glycoside hydrolase family protein [Arsenophonus sp.]